MRTIWQRVKFNSCVHLNLEKKLKYFFFSPGQHSTHNEKSLYSLGNNTTPDTGAIYTSPPGTWPSTTGSLYSRLSTPLVPHGSGQLVVSPTVPHISPDRPLSPAKGHHASPDSDKGEWNKVVLLMIWSST